MTTVTTIANAARLDPLRVVGYGLAGGLATALLIGIPTRLIPNHLFTRMTPVRPQDYVFLALAVVLTAALTASYALPVACQLQEGKLSAGGVLSFLAVGCPVCNKAVVLLLGASGALTYFQPLQPVLGVASLGLLALGLWLRLRAVEARPGAVPGTD